MYSIHAMLARATMMCYDYSSRRWDPRCCTGKFHQFIAARFKIYQPVSHSSFLLFCVSPTVLYCRSLLSCFLTTPRCPHPSSYHSDLNVHLCCSLFLGLLLLLVSNFDCSPSCPFHVRLLLCSLLCHLRNTFMMQLIPLDFAVASIIFVVLPPIILLLENYLKNTAK